MLKTSFWRAKCESMLQRSFLAIKAGFPQLEVSGLAEPMLAGTEPPVKEKILRYSEVHSMA